MVAVTGKQRRYLSGCHRPTRHNTEGLKRGAAQTIDVNNILGRENPVLVGKGKKDLEEAPCACGFSSPGFPLVWHMVSVCLSAGVGVSNLLGMLCRAGSQGSPAIHFLFPSRAPQSC